MYYTPEQKELWDKSMRMLKEAVEKPQYNAWFTGLSLYAITGDRLIMVAKNAFTLQYLRSRYGSMLTNTLDLVYDRQYTLEFYTQEDVDAQRIRIQESTLNDKYTFDNFVVSNSNNFAYAAALAVADEPSEVYNPLFIYGGVGLGKTHLMNAIGNRIMTMNPNFNVLLMTSETMTNELIEAIGRKRTAEFRSRFRNVDVLMVDDIQFLGKTRTAQEEFFHTFNELHGNHKQVIIASDRPPKDMPEIEDRLRSRFEWGLIVDVQKPDFETRVAILRQKADEDRIDVPDDVLVYISRNVSSNVRELEGCLTSLDAHARLMGTPITLELAQNALTHIIKSDGPRRITAELIIEKVAERTGLTTEDMIGPRRSRDVASARQIAMYMCREMTELSTTAIGQAFGNRDHTTVLHGCEKIADGMKTDHDLRRRVEELIKFVKEC